MKNLRTKLLITVGVLICISLFLNVTLYCSFNIFPNRLKTNTIELKDSKIPQSLDGISILYFTDLEYGEYQNDKRTDKVFKTIYNLHPDVVIFGGDLFDADYTLTDESNWNMVDRLSKIEAPLGKYALLGDFDSSSQERIDALNWIYAQSQFEVLSDTAIKVTNQKQEGIGLIGMSLNPNYQMIVDNINKDHFNLLITHEPDSLLDSMLSLASIDLAIAGHSHGTQITFPIYGGYQTIKGATKLNRTKSEDLTFDYIISTGIGCTNYDVRLNATPEIYYFILKSK